MKKQTNISFLKELVNNNVLERVELRRYGVQAYNIAEGEEYTVITKYAKQGGRYYFIDRDGRRFLASHYDRAEFVAGEMLEIIAEERAAAMHAADQIESDTGVLDWDGEYDTDIVRHLSECDDDDYQLILDAAERGEYVEKTVLAYACSALGKLLATNIKVYQSNMEVFTQEGCTTLMRDNFSAYTEDEEDEVRDLLEDEGFISESIDKIIDKMEIYEWFREEENED